MRLMSLIYLALVLPALLATPVLAQDAKGSDLDAILSEQKAATRGSNSKPITPEHGY